MASTAGAHGPSFAVLRALREGHTVLIVVDLALDPDRWMGSFPSLIELTLPILHPDERGLCDDRESERLGDLEDRLLAAADSCSHIYAGRVTGQGVRTVMFYTSKSSGFAAAMREGAASLSRGDKRIEVTSRLDPGWSKYRALAGGAGVSS